MIMLYRVFGIAVLLCFSLSIAHCLHLYRGNSAPVFFDVHNSEISEVASYSAPEGFQEIGYGAETFKGDGTVTYVTPKGLVYELPGLKLYAVVSAYPDFFHSTEYEIFYRSDDGNNVRKHVMYYVAPVTRETTVVLGIMLFVSFLLLSTLVGPFVLELLVRVFFPKS